MSSNIVDIVKSRPSKTPRPGTLALFQSGNIMKTRDADGTDRYVSPLSGTPVKAAQAAGVLTLTANAANTNTVTIGSTVYTFVTALSTGPAVPYEVKVGTAATDSIDNLISAINGASGAGSTYGTGTGAHPDVTAAIGAGDTMGVTAKLTGYDGNLIATTDTLASTSSFAAATLTGGSAGTVAVAGTVMYDSTNVYICYAATTATDTTGWRKVAHSAL